MLVYFRRVRKSTSQKQKTLNQATVHRLNLDKNN